MRAVKPTLDAVVRRLNPAFVARHSILPVAVDAQGLVAAVRDPDDRGVIDALRFATGLPAKTVEDPDLSTVGPSLIDRIVAGRASPSLEESHRTIVSPVLRLRIEGNFVWPLDDRWDGDPIACSDELAWHRLRSNVEAGSSVEVVVANEEVLPLTLPDMPRDEAELRAMLGRFAPLRLADLAWSQPYSPARPVATRQVEVTLLRRRWLYARLATIERQLAPPMVIVRDEGGHSIAFRTPALSRRRIVSAFAVAALVASAGIAGFAVARLSSPVVKHAEVAAGVPRNVQSPTATTPPTIGVSPAPVVDDKLILVGIAGRLPDDARVLMRTPWGKTVTMQKGDSLLGWRIAAIAADRVTLEQGGQRRELVVPSGP